MKELHDQGFNLSLGEQLALRLGLYQLRAVSRMSGMRGKVWFNLPVMGRHVTEKIRNDGRNYVSLLLVWGTEQREIKELHGK